MPELTPEDIREHINDGDFLYMILHTRVRAAIHHPIPVQYVAAADGVTDPWGDTWPLTSTQGPDAICKLYEWSVDAFKSMGTAARYE